MNAADLNFCLEQRRAVADKIRDDLGKYKVCTCCRSISFLEAPAGKADVCTVCKSYRWDESVEEVLLASIQAGEEPLPRFSGTVPRGIQFPKLPPPTPPTITL